jgi:hypothetical protein
MNPRHTAALALVGQSCLILGVASLLLSMVGLFLVGEYGNDSMLASAIVYIVFWPHLLLSFFLPNEWRGLFIAPIGFIFGFPLVGWGLLGIPMGLWRARRFGPVT